MKKKIINFLNKFNFFHKSQLPKKDYNNIKTHYSETAAKMWYFIKVNDEIKYRFEIRSKGNWDNSPQLLIHNI